MFSTDGSYEVSLRVTDNAGEMSVHSVSLVVKKPVVKAGTRLVLEARDSVQRGDRVELKAVLTYVEGDGVMGETVGFYVNTSWVGSTKTDSTGSAILVYTPG